MDSSANYLVPHPMVLQHTSQLRFHALLAKECLKFRVELILMLEENVMVAINDNDLSILEVDHGTLYEGKRRAAICGRRHL